MNTSEPTGSESNSSKDIKFEKYKVKIELFKWLIGSVALVIVTIIIDNGFKERTAGIQEMQAFDKYVEIILKADNIEERWKLSEFFSTVTPTDRLRMRWITYKQLINPSYETFKKLKETEFSLREKIKIEKSPESVIKLTKIKKQLEPFEQKLASSNVLTETKPIPTSLPTLNSNEPEVSLKSFKEKIQKEAPSDSRYKLDEYFKKSNEIHNAVVNDLTKELGDPYQNIQTGINYSFKESTYSNQYGIQSKFDDTKRIWPLFQAKFADNSVTVTMKENGMVETFTSPINGTVWDDMKKFIRSYFLKRLNQLS